MSRPENRVTPHATVYSTDDLLARRISAGLDRPNFLGHGMHSGVIPNPLQNAESGDWRSRYFLMLCYATLEVTLLENS